MTYEQPRGLADNINIPCRLSMLLEGAVRYKERFSFKKGKDPIARKMAEVKGWHI